MPKTKDRRSYLRKKIEEISLCLKDYHDPKDFHDNAHTHQTASHWARTNVHYANALYELAPQEELPSTTLLYYQKAIKSYQQALSFYDPYHNHDEWAQTTLKLAKALRAYDLNSLPPMGHPSFTTIKTLLENGLQFIETHYPTSNQHRKFYQELAQFYQDYAKISCSREQENPQNCCRNYYENALMALIKAGDIARNKEQFEYWANNLVQQADLYFTMSLQEPEANQCLSLLDKASNLLKTTFHYYNSKHHSCDWIYIQFQYGRICLHRAFHLTGESCHDTTCEAVFALEKAAYAPLIRTIPELRSKLLLELAQALLFLARIPQNYNRFYLIKKTIKIYREASYLHRHEGQTSLNTVPAQLNLGKILLQSGHISDLKENEKQQFQGITELIITDLRYSLANMLKQQSTTTILHHFIEIGTTLHITASQNQTETATILYEEAIHIYQTILTLIDQDPNHSNTKASLKAYIQNWSGQAFLALIETTNHEHATIPKLKEAETHFRHALAYQIKQGNCLEIIRMELNMSHLYYQMGCYFHEKQQDPKAALFYLDCACRMALRALDVSPNKISPEELIKIKWTYGRILYYRLFSKLSVTISWDLTQAETLFHELLETHSQQFTQEQNRYIHHALTQFARMRQRKLAQEKLAFLNKFNQPIRKQLSKIKQLLTKFHHLIIAQ